LTINYKERYKNQLSLSYNLEDQAYNQKILRRRSMTKDTKKKTSAFMKPVEVSPELESIVGKGPMPRTEVTKKLWDYIKKNNLQDASNKRVINPDAKLSKVLGTAGIDMFKMTSKVASHLKAIATAKA
jgi:chromatin remodeling complex protein RSC6